jgi:hypothetical protein
MVYNNDLSNSKKDKLFPIKLDEQNCTCPLCKLPFERSIFYEQSTDFDHLDRNEKNHNPNNLAVVHKECNLIKKYCAEFQVLAMEWKKHLNSKITSSLRVSERENKNESTVQPHTEADDYTKLQKDELTDGQINQIINKITKNLLIENFYEGSTKQIPFSVMLADIHYLTMQETGDRGSEPASRRALDGMTRSRFSPYEKKKLGTGNIVIQRRTTIPDKKKLPEHQKIQETTS